MKVLFVHNNFPAQFANLAAALAEADGVEMAAIGCETARALPHVELYRYRTPKALAQAHTFSRRFDNECRRAEEVLYAATNLQKHGFTPELIFVHPGWGENLPLRSLFPRAKIVVFCEYYYRREGGDMGFDPEFPSMGVDGFIGLELRNASTLLALAGADGALSPTEWQKSTYPTALQPLITVAHEGVDTDFFRPDPGASLRLPGGVTLSTDDEVLTYTTRSFEPMRGFHSFMRALPKVLAERPRAQVLIVGESNVSYGAAPRKHPNWKAAMLDEVGDRLDFSRVHFLNRQSLTTYLKVLQISSAHVYLTYPFVLSWSMLEAMSAGCLVVGSDTPPVREVIDGTNGLLAPMFDIERLAGKIVGALSHKGRTKPLGEAARATIIQRYDARTVCAPRLLRFVQEVTGRRLTLRAETHVEAGPWHAEA